MAAAPPRRRPPTHARRRSARGAGAEPVEMSVADEEPRAEDLVAEGDGDSLGEAKWSAMKQLEPRFPGITADCVRFDVVEEPAGDRPARVRGEVDVEAWRRVADTIPDEPAERVRALVGRVVHALGL